MRTRQVRQGAVSIAISISLGGCFSGGTLETAPAVDYVAVTTARYHACGLTTDGEIYCWSGSDPRPQLVSGETEFASVSSYWDHTCGVGVDRRVYCWGYNSLGQLGTDVFVERCVVGGNSTVACLVTPTPVMGDLEFTTVSVGGSHSCGLATDGAVHCWGSNASGQIGTLEEPECNRPYIPEGLACSPVPVKIDGDLVFTSISSGRSHTCGLTSEGIAYCWGAGGSGRLGNGVLADSRTATPVAGNITFAMVSAGGSHTCGVATDGTAYCWGSNTDRQLGTLDWGPECPRQVFTCITTPHPIDQPVPFATVTASDATFLAGAGALGGHSCGLTTDGRVFCWGQNEQGQIPGSQQFRTPEPVQYPGEERFSEINAGLSNTCGVTMEREINCWSYGAPLKQWVVPNS